MEVQDVKPVDPSPAVPETIDLSKLSHEDRQTWRQTGKLPEKPSPAESATAKKESSDAKADKQDVKGESSDATAKAEKDAPAPEAGKDTQEQPGKGAQARIRELNARAKAAEERAAELEKKLSERDGKKDDVKKAEPSPAKSSEPKPPAKPVRPNQDDPKFKDWAEYEAAEKKYLEEELPKYLEDLADYKAETKLREANAAREKAEAEKAFAEERKQALERYPDLDEKAIPALQKFMADDKIDPIIKGMLGTSSVKLDILYALGNDDATWDKIAETAKTDPRTALKALFAVEDAVIAEIGKGRQKPEKYEPEKKDPAPVTATKAHAKPVTEVDAKGTSSEDPGMAAARAGDFRTLKQVWNRQATERRK